MNSKEIAPRNRAERRMSGKRMRAAGAALTAGSAALAMGAAWVGTGVESAHAATTIHVSTLADSGGGSLRDALASAADGDSIVFDLPGTITLTTGQLAVTKAVTISGNSAVTINGNGDRIFYIASGITNGVTISGLTLTGASVSGSGDTGDGAAIDALSALTLTDSVVTGNTAESDAGGVQFRASGAALTVSNTTFSNNKTLYYDGAAIATDNASSVTISNSTFTGNQTGTANKPTHGDQGGALYVNDPGGPVTITGSTFTGNSTHYGGGAIFLYGTDATISGTTISGNTTAHDGGGGVKSDSDGTDQSFGLFDSVVSNNSAPDGAGGGMYLYGAAEVTIQRTTISGNSSPGPGGGVFVPETGADSTFAVGESTISGNSSTQSSGGGMFLYADEPVRIFNSTVSGNTAAVEGGGIAFYGLSSGFYLTQDTITANSATTDGGLYLGRFQGPASATRAAQRDARAAAHAKTAGTKDGGKVHARSLKTRGVHAADVGDVTVLNTILSGNVGNDVGDFGTMLADHSILGTVASGITVTDQGGNVMTTDPGVGPLAGNGGPTQTHALLAGSPAIDTGKMPVADFPGNEFDQRGDGFDRVVNETVDIGAFEVQPPPPVVVIQPKFTG